MLSASGDDHLDGNKRDETGRSGFYVDVENLKADGRAMVQGLIENWPDKAPRPIAPITIRAGGPGRFVEAMGGRACSQTWR